MKLLRLTGRANGYEVIINFEQVSSIAQLKHSGGSLISMANDDDIEVQESLDAIWNRLGDDYHVRT